MKTSNLFELCAPALAAAIVLGTGGTVGVDKLAANEPAAAAEQAVTILDENSFWRFHVTLRKPTVTVADLEAAGKTAAEPAVLAVKVPYRHYPGIEHLQTAPPPAEWTNPDFDDADWPRARAGGKWPGSIALVAFGPGVKFSTSLLCLRGKFSVEEPSAVKGLYLSLKYRGGVTVYLNGREIARKDLPEGGLGPRIPAKSYPPEAFVDSEGKPIPDPYHVAKRIEAGEKNLADRLASRNRSLGPVNVSTDTLRKGINVLAVELHRSDYHPSALSWFHSAQFRNNCGWVPVGLAEVRLAAVGTGAAANVSRPEGLQVWNQDINDRVSVLDYGDPNERPKPITLIGVRNGFFSGKVVVGSTGPIRRLKAVAGELEAAGGGHTIPASQVQVRYPRLDGHGYQRPDWFDGIEDFPPAEVPVHESGGAVQPVWVTVHVPREATAGDYRGTLTISARQLNPVVVPVHLQVADWSLPDPQDFRTYVGIYQSPTSLALQYGVPEWSQQHWKLMEKSFELLGQVGNKIVNVPLSNRTQFGNDEGMVSWLKQPDGSFEYDFTVFDRYIRLVKSHLGIPDFVAVQLWHSGGWMSRGAKQQNTVTVVDKRSGNRRPMQVPTFGTEESKQFWKPVLDTIRKRLAAEGMEEAMCLGILSDGTAEPDVFAAFDEIIPGGARWTRGCHRASREEGPYPLKGGGKVVCHEFCYGMAMADPATALPPIWKQRRWPGVAFIRHNFDDNLSLLKYRTMPERSLYCGTRGVGRIGLDFWDVVKNDRGQGSNLYNRWPHSSCAQREPNLFRLASAGPGGPDATVRFEQFRQGVQDAEAMIFVAEALGQHAEKLGPELAEQCRRIFVERIRYCSRRCPEAYGHVYCRTYHYGWQGLTARLYTTAAEVAGKLRGN